MTVSFFNTTPHVINFINGDTEVAIPASGTVARVENTFEVVDFGGVPVKVKTSAVIVDLPEAHEGTIVIVSGFVRSAIPADERPDVVSPGTGPQDNPRRSEKGWITGVRCFVR